MIRLVIDNGVQTITERCDDCGCHVRNLTIDDILVKKNYMPKILIYELRCQLPGDVILTQ